MARRKGQDGAPSAKQGARTNGNGADLGSEAQLFLAADRFRKNLESSDYKHVGIGLIFLRYISVAFETKHAALLAEALKAAEDPDVAGNVLWVPQQARWPHLPPISALPAASTLF